MKRRNAIKAIAILFIFLGILYLGSFLAPVFVASGNKNVNLSYLTYTVFLFYAGFNLYGLKESGRTLSIILLSIRIITNLALTAWFLSQKGEPAQGSIYFLGKYFPVADYRLAFVMIMLTWSLLVLLMMAFLLQKKTRELFSTKLNENPAGS